MSIRVAWLVFSALAGWSPALAQEETWFDAAGEWTILSSSPGDTQEYCVATREIEGREIRMRLADGRWTFEIAAGDTAGEPAGFEIDGQRHPVVPRREGGRLVLALTAPGMEAVRNGRRAVVGLPEGPAEVPLNGTAAAALRVEDCLRLGGAAQGDAGLLVEPGAVEEETGPIGANCPAREDAASAWEGTDTVLTLIVAAGAPEPLTLFWVDPFGRLLPVPARLDAAAGEVSVAAYAGQGFVIRAADGSCRGGLIRPEAVGTRLEIR